MTLLPVTAVRLLEELAWSECGALTDVAIRERVMYGIRAAATLRRAGLVAVTTEDCWLEDDRQPARMLLRTAQVIRLTAAGRDAADQLIHCGYDPTRDRADPGLAAAPLLPGLDVAPSGDRQPPPTAGRRR